MLVFCKLLFMIFQEEKMRRIVSVTVLCIGLLSSTVSAANYQKIIPVDSQIYEMVDALYAEVGYAPAVMSYPVTVGELKDVISYIPERDLSSEGKELLRQVRMLCSPEEMSEKTFKGSVGFEPALEFYIHQDEVNYDEETDWIYDYDSRKPLITIPLEAFMTDYIYSETDLAVLKTRYSYNNSTGVTDSTEIFSPKFSFNNPFDESLVNHVDLNFPERAVASAGFDRINVTIGRDDLKWGTGNTGTLTVGDHLDYYDFVKFSTYHENFKYTYMVSGFDSPSWTSAIQNSAVDDDDTSFSDSSDNLKMYVAHRGEFRLFDKRVTLAVTEAMMYQTSAVDFRYLNPSMFYHNLFIRGNGNSTLAFELNVNPYRYLNVYGSVVLDEFPYPGEDQSSSGAHPTGIGQQYGVEGVYPLGKGYISAFIEYVHTDPYLYLRDSVDYIVNRRIFNMETGFSIKKNFLGYEYGNDTIVVAAGVDYWVADSFTGSLSVTYKLHGETNIDSTWGKGPDHVNRETPYDDPSTPNLTVEESLKVSAGAQLYPFRSSQSKHLRNISLMGQVDFISHQNKDNEVGLDTFDIQLILGAGWKL